MRDDEADLRDMEFMGCLTCSCSDSECPESYPPPLPDFLLEMSKQMNAENNRSTSDPIWQVCFDDKVLTDEDFSDGYRIETSEGFLLFDSNSMQYDSIFITYVLEEHGHLVEEYKKCAIEEDSEFSFENHFCIEDFEHSVFDDGDYFVKYYYKKVRTVVRSCLTEEDAECFISRKQHDYMPLYTYVDSMVYCPQMIELRNWIKGLTR